MATVDTALALLEAGAEVDLYALEGDELPERAAPLADRVVQVRRPALQDGKAATALFLAAKLAVSRSFAQALRGKDYDAVHVLSPGMAARLPAEHTVSVQAWFHPPTLRDRLRIMLPFAPSRASRPASFAVQVQSHLSDLAGYRRADLVVGNTEPAAAALAAKGLPAVCVPPAIAVGSEPIAREPSEQFRIVFCATGLGAKRKGLTHLLTALESVDRRPLRLTLVGEPDGRLEPAYQRLRDRGVDVRVLGALPRHEYLRLLETEADLLAFPSLYEEWGYALLEAVGRGVPVVAFDTYPYSEIVDPRMGSLARFRDGADLAHRIQAMAEERPWDPDAVRAATRERFGSENVARRLREAWEAR